MLTERVGIYARRESKLPECSIQNDESIQKYKNAKRENATQPDKRLEQLIQIQPQCWKQERMLKKEYHSINLYRR